MNTHDPDTGEIQQQLAELLAATDALMLATVDGAGVAQASYAPYVQHDGRFYIFISALASHTTNLEQSGLASVLFMANNDAGHAFTRKRLSCHCRASAIERDNGLFEAVMQLLEKRFGKLLATLRGLGDFQLFQLEPVQGNFVAGFGQAFSVDFPLGAEIRHTRPN